MIKSNVYDAPPFVLSRLKELYRKLHLEKDKIEKIANHMEEQKASFAVRSLAQSCNQNAHEILSQIQMIEGAEPEYIIVRIQSLLDHPSKFQKDKRGPNKKAGVSKIQKKDFLSLYKQEERSLINAYREILNEPFLQSELRSLIQVQLNEILCNFVQLKLSAQVS